MSNAVATVMAVWLALMASTAASTWWFSQPTFAPAVGTIAVMVIATIKVGLVMAYFMEMRIAPRVLQLIGAIWIVGAASTVMIIYLL